MWLSSVTETGSEKPRRPEIRLAGRRGERLRPYVRLHETLVAEPSKAVSMMLNKHTWQQFLARHAEVLLCVGLFTKEVWTCTGLRTA